MIYFIENINCNVVICTQFESKYALKVIHLKNQFNEIY